MKKKTHSHLLACTLSLMLVPVAFAKDTDKKFDKLDANGDGQVSRAEHTTGGQRMFTEMDADRDGIVTATEMAAKKDAKSSDKETPEMSAAEKIRMVDQNGDGRLTAAEHAVSCVDMFGKMDTNGDGALSKTELEAGHKMKKKNK